MEEMVWADHDREEKLAWAERKKKEWETIRLSRMLVFEMMSKAVTKVEEYHVINMLENVMDEAWTRLETKRILKEIMDTDVAIQERVEKILLEKRQEERDLIEIVQKEENKQERLKKIQRIKLMNSKKMKAQRLKSLLEKLRRLNLGDEEMDLDEIERVVVELMEFEETDEIVPMEVFDGDRDSMESLVDVEMIVCNLGLEDASENMLEKGCGLPSNLEFICNCNELTFAKPTNLNRTGRKRERESDGLENKGNKKFRGFGTS